MPDRAPHPPCAPYVSTINRTTPRPHACRAQAPASALLSAPLAHHLLPASAAARCHSGPRRVLIYALRGHCKAIGRPCTQRTCSRGANGSLRPPSAAPPLPEAKRVSLRPARSRSPRSPRPSILRRGGFTTMRCTAPDVDGVPAEGTGVVDGYALGGMAYAGTKTRAGAAGRTYAVSRCAGDTTCTACWLFSGEQCEGLGGE